MKNFSLILACTLNVPLCADTIYTVPQGYTRVIIAAATPEGSTLTSISANLLNDVEYSGSVSIGAFTDNPEGPDSQTLTVAGATWAATQWTSEPFLAYLSVADDVGNADGIAPAEEAFYVQANNATGELTLETTFDLNTRFPSATSLKLRKANTLDSLFGDSARNFASTDLVYIWDGEKWDSFQFIAGAPGYWASTTDGFTNVGPITIIRPDEGIFVSRTLESDVVLTLFGEIPSAPQISTIEGASFVASRFPVDTTLADTGIANASWESADLLYIWNQSATPSAKWDSYQYISGAPGYWASTTDGFTPVDDTIIPANSAIFVVRASEINGSTGGTVSTLPYTIGNEE